MYRVLTAAQTRDLERATVRKGGSLADMMEAAGIAVARVADERFSDGTVVVVAGPGGNGGDGWVAARHLAAWGRPVRVVSLSVPDELANESAAAARLAIEQGVEYVIPPDDGFEQALLGASVIVDAVLGVGARLPLSPRLSAVCAAINRSGARVVSADLPTGVDSDTAAADANAVHADATVTFSELKRGLVLHPGYALAGEVIVADVGARPDEELLSGTPVVFSRDEFAGMLPVHASDVHKNQRGRLLVIAGSRSYPGAAVLAARGAQRMGAGYVTLAVPQPVVRIAQAHLASVPVIGLPAGRTGSFASSAASALIELASDHAAVVVGPGLTLSDGAVATVRALTSRVEAPLVLDADGLNAFVDATHLITERRSPTVLTPHPGELARLLGVDATRVQTDRVSSSKELAAPGRVVVLKGAGTVVADGTRTAVNTSGSWALATAGSGDVLAGMIGALLAQGVAPFDAGALGAWLHGRAGDAAAATLTPWCVTAEDVSEYLPVAVGELIED